MTRSQWLLCHLYPELRVEGGDGDTYTVIAINQHDMLVQDKEGCDFEVGFNSGRPIFRDLSTMTEEEKREFAEAHGYDRTGDFDSLRIIWDNDQPLIEINPSDQDNYWTARLSLEEFIWLLERGFYVGQCPREECVVE